jgi:hypothetical protein
LIATAIVLSLIPLYTPAKSLTAATATETENLVIQLSNGQTLLVGPLNSNQLAIVQNYVSVFSSNILYHHFVSFIVTRTIKC